MLPQQLDANAELAELVRLRRMFHHNPELGFREFWTTARIAEYLAPLNCQLLYGNRLKESLSDPGLLPPKLKESDRRFEKDELLDDEWREKLQEITGLVAIIKGREAGPKFGFRFDIDGLPIVESNEEAHLPYKLGFHSPNGRMHACGHDGHITIGLGLARRLVANADRLKGEFYLLFQPAEESILGGRIFSKLNFIRDLDYFIAMHLGLIGRRKIVCGLSFLSDRRYRVLFKGKKAHSAAIPQEGQNALLAACHAAVGLFGISRHSGGRSRINIGRFQSGNASNIIADAVEFELDLRGESSEVCEYLTSRAEDIIAGAAKMQGVQVEMDLLSEAETAINSVELIDPLKRAGLAIGFSPDDIVESAPVSASEDATFIMNEVATNGGRSSYVGICCPTYGGHHNEKFDFDEDVLLTGVDLLERFVLNILEAGQ